VKEFTAETAKCLQHVMEQVNLAPWSYFDVGTLKGGFQSTVLPSRTYQLQVSKHKVLYVHQVVIENTCNIAFYKTAGVVVYFTLVVMSCAKCVRINVCRR